MVIVCVRSKIQETYGISYETRERETGRAMEILGCSWGQWTYPDDDPDWDDMEHHLAGLDPEHVWAPEPLDFFHDQHHTVGTIAQRLFPGRVTFYTTYSQGGVRQKSDNPVLYEPWMLGRKLQALSCYQSQLDTPSYVHFAESMGEWYA